MTGESALRAHRLLSVGVGGAGAVVHRRIQRALARCFRWAHGDASEVSPCPPQTTQWHSAAPDPRGAWAAATFSAQPKSAAQARRMVRQHLLRWELLDVMDDALLVVTELVANAVCHGTEQHGAREPRVTASVEVQLRIVGQELYVAVTDSRPTAVPVLNGADADAEEGRGLRLVEANTTRWGWRRAANGRTKLVWAVLRLRSATPS
ncbi:ATP-binding protein [Streptomyces millisiae]|uniref:ATP-binding protein n=1 Tax=Streptomyces millisiae TaxID=3075542 RepID=A0ABU2LWC5_9ACTN|nr:ATP-binding protein [Streptomyces sp. DSM 44918]MDT0321895.1 ATP-binding protein [Streptomyces sp. DSM 44918]